MRTKRTKISGADAVYHCMTRTVNGKMLFKNRDEVREHGDGKSE